jgi:hypothetical protein
VSQAPTIDYANESERDFVTRLWSSTDWGGTDRMRLLCMAENILTVGEKVRACELDYHDAYALLKELKAGFK